MKRLALPLLLLFLFAFAGAQQRLNYLAVDGVIIDAAGPFYFTAYGDSSNAYAKAVHLAEAMGLTTTYLDADKVLVFSDGFRTARFQATSDVADGLIKREGVVSVTPPVAGATSLASPKVILVDGVSYVAIAPLVKAFEGEAGWNSERRVVTVDTATRLGYSLGKPRTGLTDGVSRVAVDIPTDASYDVAANDHTLLITFPGARAEESVVNVGDGNLTTVSVTNGGGYVSVVLRTAFELSTTGQGFRLGEVDKGATRTVYVDLAPGLVGAAVAALAQPEEPVVQTPVALTTVPEQRRIIVIDAGHGGRDPGANSSYATEKHVVLSVALRLKALLEREGIEVILTRDDDTFLSLQERSLFSSSDRNLFISIHANAVSDTRPAGIETWVFGEPLNPSLLERAIRENGGGAEGQALTEEARQAAASIAADILREAQLNYSLSLAETVQRNLVAATGANDRGVRQNLFYVIRNARIPAILVELGFVSNPDEGRKLATESYQQTLAQALADGVLEFLQGGGLSAQR
ncbi:MAG: N-acetylmuramoyl-L-alanine amidase [Trueperaceae bacterium]